ncbi:MAG: hypothetical protein ACHQM6_04675 [Candidatus Kapaibacterium sp.]
MQFLQKAGIPLLLFFLFGCDKGLAPPLPAPTVSGSIHFIGTPKDSVQALLVVIIQAPPPYQATYLLAGAAAGTIKASSLSITSFHDTTYSIAVSADTAYRYLGVAQKYGYDVTKDWHAVGFAHDAKDSALVYLLKPGEQRTGVDLIVNFDSLPRQPFIP